MAKEGTTIVASGTPDQPVRFQSAAGLIMAQEIRLDLATQQLKASGTVSFERERQIERKELRARRLPTTKKTETVRETAFGNNLFYDFKTGEGTLDSARLRLATISISTESLTINGKSYKARNVVLRPGGLSDEELKIYGTPPFSLHAREITATPVEIRGKSANRVTVRGGGLYFKSTRILPVPSYSFVTGGPKNDGTRLIPGISFNSGDHVLVTTNFVFPINKLNPDRLNAVADVGYSERVGFRGGLSLNSTLPAGRFELNARKNDVVSTQLTNRIVLDRRPELTYSSPRVFAVQSGQTARGFHLRRQFGRFQRTIIGQ